MAMKILPSKKVMASAISSALKVSIVSALGVKGVARRTSRSTFFSGGSFVIIWSSDEAALCSAGSRVVLWTSSSRNSVVMVISFKSFSKSCECFEIQ